MKKIALKMKFLLVVGFVLLLAACGTEDSKSGAASNGSQKTIKIGIQKIAALTDAWIAEKEGFFKEQGLNVELIEFKSGSESINAQRSGSVDIILSAPGTAMVANQSGFDLVAIAQNEISKTEGPDTASVQVLKESNIKTLKDLENKKIAIYDSRNQLVLGLKKIITEAGADVSKVSFVEVPFASMADALKNKQVDAISLVDPYTTQVFSEGITDVISWNYVESIPGQPVGAWYARSEFAEKNEEVIEKFNTALTNAIAYMREDESRAKENIVAFTGVDKNLVENMPAIEWSNEINEATWQQIVDMYVEAGELEESHDVKEYFSKTIIDTLK